MEKMSPMENEELGSRDLSKRSLMAHMEVMTEDSDLGKLSMESSINSDRWRPYHDDAKRGR